MSKSDSVINDRLQKLEMNNQIFTDFIKDSTESLFDENLTINQIKELTTNNSLIYEKSSRYIGRTYSALKEAVSFMNELERRALLSKISSSTDNGLTKKLKKQLAKSDVENSKQISLIKASKSAPTNP